MGSGELSPRWYLAGSRAQRATGGRGPGGLGARGWTGTRSRETWEPSDLGGEECGRQMLPGWETLPYVTLGDEERGA